LNLWIPPLQEKELLTTDSHSKYGRKQPQRFALQARNSGVFITQVWGIIPTSLFRNTEDDDSS
jgi:hypothetical protein